MLSLFSIVISTLIIDHVFFFNDTPTTEIYTYCHTLSLLAALPIGEEVRFRTQSLLYAAGWARRAQRSGSADDQGVPVRHGLQRFRDRVGIDPQSVARNDDQGVRAGRAVEGRRRGAFRGALSRLPIRRTAAWRHGGRGRSRGDAVVRCAEFARDHAVPDEPARRGSADERAVAGQHETTARAFDPCGRAARSPCEEGRRGDRLAQGGLTAGRASAVWRSSGHPAWRDP